MPTSTQMVYGMVGATMSSFGTMLEMQDTNTTGTDDLAGQILEHGGAALRALATGTSTTKFDQALDAIAAAIVSYKAGKTQTAGG